MDELDGMTLTEAVRAVNEAGFTIHIDHNYFDRQPGKLGFFSVAGEGSYEVVNTVDGIDGYVVQGMCGIVAPGPMTTPEKVQEALADKEPRERREYVSLPTGGAAPPDVKHAANVAIEENPGAVTDYRKGNHRDGAMNYLVGRVLHQVGGGVDPAIVQEELREQL